MKVIFIQIGKTDQSYIRDGVARYESRLKHYIPLNIITVPEVKRSKKISENRIKELEGNAISDLFKSQDHIILLDEGGDQPDSVKFAGLIEKYMISGIKRLVFVSGGAYGFSSKVYERAHSKLSVSKMTFSHQMIRLLFLEQLYRAMTIIRGDPYHHG
ncbi:MAG: 23S rRNA (pseudouridine(1915)-N(3))-methyltransferase RlmH [Bacteroidales bacterium]|nr:MAG: 23S rRNA (pseudouridine(1915)-N(3))-methyltransferase RlmH [Bacteroidales bacterium]